MCCRSDRAMTRGSRRNQFARPSESQDQLGGDEGRGFPASLLIVSAALRPAKVSGRWCRRLKVPAGVFVPPPANGKTVSWLLGRDGDVAVLVIGGEADQLASKFICSGLGEKKAPNLPNNTK